MSESREKMGELYGNFLCGCYRLEGGVQVEARVIGGSERQGARFSIAVIGMTVRVTLQSSKSSSPPPARRTTAGYSCIYIAQ